MTVVKGFLIAYQNNNSTALFNERNDPNTVNPMTISLNGAENILNASGEITNNNLVPSIILNLRDK